MSLLFERDADINSIWQTMSNKNGFLHFWEVDNKQIHESLYLRIKLIILLVSLKSIRKIINSWENIKAISFIIIFCVLHNSWGMIHSLSTLSCLRVQTLFRFSFQVLIDWIVWRFDMWLKRETLGS